MTLQALALFFSAAVAIGGVAWVFLYPLLSGERAAEKRMVSVAKPDTASRKAGARPAQRARREQVEDTLRDIEVRRRKQKWPPLSVRLAQAGVRWSKRRFLATAATAGGCTFLLAIVLGGDLLAAAGLAFGAGVGLPLWLLTFLKKRREAKFLDGFPDAVDVIVRGIKAGLPLLDSMKVICADSPEPIRGEFRAILETQAIGMPIGEACAKLYERIPLPEANFFAIVISIQQQAGGNLSEALGNLSRVLRDRKKMKAKIKAMSMEAKASAAIIGALPILVMLVVYITSPNYISLLWTTALGRLLLLGSAAWMTLGIIVMRKMINFDF